MEEDLAAMMGRGGGLQPRWTGKGEQSGLPGRVFKEA